MRDPAPLLAPVVAPAAVVGAPGVALPAAVAAPLHGGLLPPAGAAPVPPGGGLGLGAGLGLGPGLAMLAEPNAALMAEFAQLRTDFVDPRGGERLEQRTGSINGRALEGEGQTPQESEAQRQRLEQQLGRHRKTSLLASRWKESFDRHGAAYAALDVVRQDACGSNSGGAENARRAGGALCDAGEDEILRHIASRFAAAGVDRLRDLGKTLTTTS